MDVGLTIGRDLRQRETDLLARTGQITPRKARMTNDPDSQAVSPTYSEAPRREGNPQRSSKEIFVIYVSSSCKTTENLWSIHHPEAKIQVGQPFSIDANVYANDTPNPFFDCS